MINNADFIWKLTVERPCFSDSNFKKPKFKYFQATDHRFIMHLSGMPSFSTFQHAFCSLSDALFLLSGPMHRKCLCCDPVMQVSGPQPRDFIIKDHLIQGFSFSFQMPFPMIPYYLSSSRTGELELNETFNPSMQISEHSGPKP